MSDIMTHRTLPVSSFFTRMLNDELLFSVKLSRLREFIMWNKRILHVPNNGAAKLTVKINYFSN